MVNAILRPFIGIAAIGLVASAIVHICALLKLPIPFGQLVWILHGGIFVVWIPAVLSLQRTLWNQKFKQKDFWNVALKGCPKWMRIMVHSLFVYAAINFAIFLATTHNTRDAAGAAGPDVIRGFSGHWMIFYSAALAILYSATKHVEAKCSRGHAVSLSAKFCEECGSAVATTIDGSTRP